MPLVTSSEPQLCVYPVYCFPIPGPAPYSITKVFENWGTEACHTRSGRWGWCQCLLALQPWHRVHPPSSSPDHCGCDPSLLHPRCQCLDRSSCHHSPGSCPVLCGHQTLPGTTEHLGECPRIRMSHLCLTPCLPPWPSS